ncbi:ABC transporter periplasmic binding protein, thiB subfamily [Propionimicrobium lymphophilum ACS-093-V-SCH5]|uniref:ABC transporter periplasmic binding protein, thiB subfamily n=2 Tax=Propionimicrobium TaxID=203133 RepID=S2W791_9ACTN|nr:ABC transporter periplasmic binding protein, thiB subfamily [Propionimicrobium lymphophilum ACS-093-V-SCH5]
MWATVCRMWLRCIGTTGEPLRLRVRKVRRPSNLNRVMPAEVVELCHNLVALCDETEEVLFLAGKSFKLAAAGLAVCTAFVMSGCGASETGAEQSAAQATKEVTLVAYDSFPAKDIQPGFEAATGYKLNVIEGGDSAELTNKLVVSKDNPLGDVAVGMDNNTALTAYEKGVFDDSGVKLPEGVEKYSLADADHLVPFDRSQYCINYDEKWLKDKNITAPTSLADLTKPEYKDMLIVEDPRKSTPGMGFMTATIAAQGEDWTSYWSALKDNGVEIADGWTEAFAKFSSNEGGTKPMMAGFASSSAYPTGEDEAGNEIYNMKTLAGSCYDAVEYMGLLKGAKNVDGAKALIEYLVTTEAQEIISEANYMYPVNPAAKLPEALAKYGPEVENALSLDAKKVADNRTEWLKTWADTMGR